MKLRKKLTSLLLAFAMIAGLLPSFAPVARAAEGNTTRHGVSGGLRNPGRQG